MTGYRAFGPRPKGMYPVASGILHAELLPPPVAHELTVADRTYREPFVGITTDGTVRPGLYRPADTGASPRAALEAARAYLDALAPHQRSCAVQPMDSAEWRHWTNAFPSWAPRGLQLGTLDAAPRDAALALVASGLGPEGFATVRAAMRLNGALGELVGDYPDTLHEWAYWFTVYGDPAGGDPWGWQLMGHHVDVHCVHVGGQVVLAPVFLGAEPADCSVGTFAGTRAFDAETDRGLALRRALDGGQAERAVLSATIDAGDPDLPDQLAGPFNGRHRGGAGADNLVLPPEGLPVRDLTGDQRDLLLELVGTYVSRLPAEPARAKLDQVRAHLDDTHFCWRGRHDDTGAFYYRVHSPVLLVEYDNHPGIFLDNDQPERFHVHTILREPNGNDYGFDLLAQHYARHHR